MNTHTSDPVASSYEILDVSSGRVDYVDELADHGELVAGSVELDVVARRVDDRAQRPGRTALRWRSWVALVLAFGLGLAAGAVPSQSGDLASAEPAASLIAGQASVSGPVDPDSGVVPLQVALRTASTHDAEVLAVHVGGWPGQVGAVRRVETVSAGYWRNVSSAVRVDCRLPQPSAPTEVEVHIRTGAGNESVIIPLPRQMRDLVEAWQGFCPAPEPAPWPPGLLP